MQEIDCATLVVETLRLDVTPRAFLDKCRAMEEKEMANVKFMHGNRIKCYYRKRAVVGRSDVAITSRGL